MAWQDAVAQTVSGLGFDLVDLERSAGGTLRVTIDWPWEPPAQEGSELAPERFVTVEDCESVTRQLQYVLEVEGYDYKRLEVGSPGIDRPLRHENDFIRFAGQIVDITLKAPMSLEEEGATVKRKKFRGELERAGDGEQWQVVWTDAPPPKPGARVSKKRPPPPMKALTFRLDEISQARLAPLVNFKGRKVPGTE